MREENRSLKEYFFEKYNKNSSFHFSYLNFSEREKKQNIINEEKKNKSMPLQLESNTIKQIIK